MHYTKIKYDYRDQLRSLIVAIVASVITFAAWGMSLSPLFDTLATELMVFIVLGGCVFAPILALASWIVFAMSIGYLRRLTRYGYEIPLHKRSYKGLEELPRNSISVTAEVRNSRDSVVLAVICCVSAIGCVFAVIPVIAHYQMYGLLVFYAGTAVLWLVLGMHYFRQRSRVLYRDDVEPEETPEDSAKKPRKVRTHFAEGLVTVVVMMFITILFLMIVYHLSGVIFRARLVGGAGV